MQVLIADKLDESALEVLRKTGLEVIVKTGLAGDELKIAVVHADVIAVRSQTKVNKEIIAVAKKLKLIVRAGVGLDNIDLHAAEAAGILVRNTPSATSISVAELCIGLMLALVRHIPQAHITLSAGTWEKSAFAGSELFGKTLGLLGLGRIGQEVAKRAQAFGMRVIAYDPYLKTEQLAKLDIPLLSFDEVLQKAQILSLHLPLTAQTHNLLNAEKIALMPKGAYLVNCARGGIIDEAAAAEALKTGHLRGAAFDVFAEEPLKTSPLQELSNVILTPHLGASTQEGQYRASQELAQIIVDFFEQRQQLKLRPISEEDANEVVREILDQPLFAMLQPLPIAPAKTEEFLSIV